MGKHKTKIIAAIASAAKNYRTSRQQLITSCISLFLTTVILVSSVFCWFAMQSGKAVGDFQVKVPNGLRLSYQSNDSNQVIMEDDMTFIPASSVGGQNLFFPSDGSFPEEVEDGFVTRTKSQIYRRVSAGDVGHSFLQFDFKLTSYNDSTEVFIDTDKTFIRDHRTKEPVAAMRIAFVYDNGQKETVVMNPTEATTDVQAVESINFGTGDFRKSALQRSRPFSYYTASAGHSLFTMSGGEQQTLSVVVWLEGTDPQCTVDKIAAKELDMQIQFTTSWDAVDIVEFTDDTTDKWIMEEMKNGAKLELVYKCLADELDDEGNLKEGGLQKGDVMRYLMSSSDNNAYSCKIPKNYYNEVRFVLTTKSGTVYTFDKEPDVVRNGFIIKPGDSTINRGSNTSYIAKGSRVDPRGYWETDDLDNDIGQEIPPNPDNPGDPEIWD